MLALRLCDASFLQGCTLAHDAPESWATLERWLRMNTQHPMLLLLDNAEELLAGREPIEAQVRRPSVVMPTGQGRMSALYAGRKTHAESQ